MQERVRKYIKALWSAVKAAAVVLGILSAFGITPQSLADRFDPFPSSAGAIVHTRPAKRCGKAVQISNMPLIYVRTSPPLGSAGNYTD